MKSYDEFVGLEKKAIRGNDFILPPKGTYKGDGTKYNNPIRIPRGAKTDGTDDARPGIRIPKGARKY